MNILIYVVAIVAIFIVVSKLNTIGVKQISAIQAAGLIKEADILILDVRTPQEFNEGHIENARNIPVSEIADKTGSISAYKEKPVLVYCHSGARSFRASKLLHRAGFTKTRNLNGGMMAWKSQGFPVAK